MDWEDLAQARATLNAWVLMHPSSVQHFAVPGGGGSYFRTLDERDAPSGSSSAYLTTSVACLESLAELPSWLASGQVSTGDVQTTLTDYMAAQLGGGTAQLNRKWRSDGAAEVYCRVRTVASHLRLATPTARQLRALERLIKQAWSSRSGSGSGGLRDASLTRKPIESTYPPNAHLTYWGLLALTGLRRHSSKTWSSPMGDEDVETTRQWLVDNTARQVAYRSVESPLADPQQLGWSLCGLVRFSDPADLDNVYSAEHELLAAGLRAFFAQMDSNGDWPLGAPLFHYQSSGNAYSYIYELLGEMFSLAAGCDVESRAAASLSRELVKHWDHIKVAYTRAWELRQTVPGNHGVVVWASGHRPRRTPEGWATASAFRFLQSLRRVVARWSSDAAKVILDARTPRGDLTTLVSRGSTYDTGRGGAGLYLRLAFLWPIQQQATSATTEPGQRLYSGDADEPVLRGAERARSALLFGPPGTGKTTLVESLAAALGWSFVEISPAAFLDEGLDRVSARADEIFRQIMEVDRCVVLLDEIDELIQHRGPTSDPLERFFTTTMLPRLAKLWDLGRVLFFVNTNDVTRVDPAIRRSQRFDAALLVLPPSYEIKRSMLERKGVQIPVDERAVAKAYEDARVHEKGKRRVGGPINPAWFGLMRYDQIDSFAAAYEAHLIHLGAAAAAAGTPLAGRASRLAFDHALQQIVRELMALDYLPADTAASSGENLNAPSALPPSLIRMRDAERRDSRRKRVWASEDEYGFPAGYVVVPQNVIEPLEWALSKQYEINPVSGRLVGALYPAAGGQSHHVP